MFLFLLPEHYRLGIWCKFGAMRFLNSRYCRQIGGILLLGVLCSATCAGATDSTKDRDAAWWFALTLEAHYWSANGSVVNETLGTQSATASFVATGDSLNLQQTWAPELTAAAGRGRWYFGLDFLDINYPTTEGTGQASADFGSLGGFLELPLTSDIDLRLLLARMGYKLVDTENSALHLGFGFGQVDVEMHMQSQTLFAMDISEQSPFGTLDIKMTNHINRFSYGFALSGSYIELSDVAESYVDFEVRFGYRLQDGPVQIDLVGGFRQADVTLGLTYGLNQIDADIKLNGPFVGITTRL